MRKLLTIFSILLIASFFRLSQLNKVPPSPSLDEVSIGWNAYSILETGRDEYGYRLPILLRAYDDWRPALYVYLTIPFIKFFGLSAETVRLPAAILGILTVFLSYFLVQELFQGRNFPKKQKVIIGLITSFLLAVSPWHIYISRLGHEVGAGLTFSVLAVLFFLKFINQKKAIFIYLSALIFSISFYTYQSQKIFGPLIIICLVLIFRKQVWESKKPVLLAGLLGLFLLIPILKISFSPGGLARFQGVSIFRERLELSELSLERLSQNRHSSTLDRLFDGQKIAVGLTLMRGYFSHFDPTWLFFNRAKEQHKVPGLGLFYFWELPLMLLGAFELARGSYSRKTKFLIVFWILVAPLPATIATQTPHGMRIFNLLPMPQMLAALGLLSIISKYKDYVLKFKLKLRKYLTSIVLCFCFLFLIFNLSYLHHNYFDNFPIEQADSFQYQLSQAIHYVLGIEDRYQKIIFSNWDNCQQSYMFYLFFSRCDPRTYLSQGGTISGGADKIHKIGKYEFRPIDWGNEKQDKNILYVGNSGDFPEGIGSLQAFGLKEEYQAIKLVIK